MKAAVAVPEQDGEAVVLDGVDSEVELPVPVEVRGAEVVRGVRERDRRPRRGREAASTVTEQDRERAGGDRDRKVGVTVAVEVGGREPRRTGSHDDRRDTRELTAAVAEQDRHVVVELVRDR